MFEILHTVYLVLNLPIKFTHTDRFWIGRRVFDDYIDAAGHNNDDSNKTGNEQKATSNDLVLDSFTNCDLSNQVSGKVVDVCLSSNYRNVEKIGHLWTLNW